jgi:hypothetical protein
LDQDKIRERLVKAGLDKKDVKQVNVSQYGYGALSIIDMMMDILKELRDNVLEEDYKLDGKDVAGTEDVS